MENIMKLANAEGLSIGGVKAAIVKIGDKSKTNGRFEKNEKITQKELIEKYFFPSNELTFIEFSNKGEMKEVKRKTEHTDGSYFGYVNKLFYSVDLNDNNIHMTVFDDNNFDDNSNKVIYQFKKIKPNIWKLYYTYNSKVEKKEKAAKPFLPHGIRHKVARYLKVDPDSTTYHKVFDYVVENCFK